MLYIAIPHPALRATFPSGEGMRGMTRFSKNLSFFVRICKLFSVSVLRIWK